MKDLALKALIVIASIVGFWFFAAHARAHEIPGLPVNLSIFYDEDCCSDEDCKPIPAEEVSITGHGYVWRGELFGYQSERLKWSPDGRYHGCEYYTHDGAGKVERPCLYVPVEGL